MHLHSMQSLQIPWLITCSGFQEAEVEICCIKLPNAACVCAGIHVPGGDAPEESGQRTPGGL